MLFLWAQVQLEAEEMEYEKEGGSGDVLLLLLSSLLFMVLAIVALVNPVAALKFHQVPAGMTEAEEEGEDGSELQGGAARRWPRVILPTVVLGSISCSRRWRQ